MKLCMRKCEIVKKIEICIWVILLQIARILGKRKCDTLKFHKNFFPASLTKFNRHVLQDFAGKKIFT